MLSRTEHNLNEYIRVKRNVVEILDDAARAEKFLAKPNNKRCPSMYQLLETYYTPEDWGYHTSTKMILRATPKQMQNYDTALDILLMVNESVSDNPMIMRKIIWLKATRNSFVKIGKYLGYHRTTVRRMYDNVLEKITNKIIKESIDIVGKKFH